MAAATYSVTTGGTDLVKIRRKVTGEMLTAFATECEEYKWHSKLTDWKLAPSLREVITPVRIRRNGGGASITEGGYEASPMTLAPEELTFTFQHWNFRYTTSRLAKLLNPQASKAEVFSQLKFQGISQCESMKEKFAQHTYGFSTGVVCLTSTGATQASGTYTLIDAYGKSDLDTAAYIAQFFKVGERVALVRAGALVANAIGVITAVTPATPSIAVTWNGSVDSDANDQVVFANNLENTTLAGGTDYNKWPIGLMDVIETASIHGLSSSTAPLWAGYHDTTGGRFNFVRLRKMQNAIKNNGGGTPDSMIMAQGVEVDCTDALLANNRYGSTVGMQLDGSTAVKGIKNWGGTRWTPNSRVWLFDSSDFKKWEPVGAIPDESGNLPDSSNNLVVTDKLQDVSADVTGTDYLFGRVFTNRGNFALSSGLAEQ
jgi:hypothetical protein